MIILPKVRGFICTTAHPIGCSHEVSSQIAYVKAQGQFSGPKKVLIIGASTGYGLASRITATFGSHASTIGVFYERPAEDKRTATAGWYNTAAFEKLAQAENYYAKSINGDAFSTDIKRRTADLIRHDLGQVDLIVYSLAAPRRVHPETGKVYSSVLKPMGRPFTSKTVDPFRKEVKEVTLDSANQEEIDHTLQVMGGEDWQMWLDFLSHENLLAEGLITVAYTYIGPKLTYPIYKEGTIGQAKEHLHMTANHLNERLKPLQGKAYISVNKALVTQASAAIPVVPLYISLLYKLMKQKGTHEGCIEQMTRLFKDHLYSSAPEVDNQGFIRLDDREMQADIQTQIADLWPIVNSDNLCELSDIEGYCNDFYHLFGFNEPHVNYQADVNPDVKIDSIQD
jgi:enoyl-[acyl-carrier protein] reductase / trans-2-enoyl-CoA reductase (NAD+)